MKTYKDLSHPYPNGVEERNKFYEKYGDLVPKPYRNLVLCKTYIPPEQTSGGIYMPNQTLENSAYQNMIGLVLDMGPTAFKRHEEDFDYWDGVAPQKGEWVMMPRFEFVMMTFLGWQDDNENSLEKIELRMVFDVKLMAPVTDPGRFTGAHVLGR